MMASYFVLCLLVYIILETDCLHLLPLLFLGINLVNGLSSQEQTPKGLGVV